MTEDDDNDDDKNITSVLPKSAHNITHSLRNLYIHLLNRSSAPQNPAPKLVFCSVRQNTNQLSL